MSKDITAKIEASYKKSVDDAVVSLKKEWGTDYQKNLDNMNALNKLCEKYYPGLSRGIYKKSGPGVNGIYNQDINEFTMLIEVGSYTNTIDEVFNTIEALSNILYKYIKGENI